MTLIVTNDGTAASDPLIVRLDPNSPNFVISNDTCDGETLAPNDWCSFDLTWTAPAGCDTEDQFHGSFGVYGDPLPYLFVDARAFCI